MLMSSPLYLLPLRLLRTPATRAGQRLQSRIGVKLLIGAADDAGGRGAAPRGPGSMKRVSSGVTLKSLRFG